jgi:CspA family cold shock protein
MKGTIKFFNESKGYGFITAENGKEIFFHVSGIFNNEILAKDDKVKFDVVDGDRGEKASEVMKLD